MPPAQFALRPLWGFRLLSPTIHDIYVETYTRGQRVIECVYAARRSVVYELFAELLKNRIG